MYLPVEGYFFTLIVPEGIEKGTYQSSLYKIDSHHLYISSPRTADQRLTIKLAPGTKVILDYRDDKDIPCRFETVVDELPDGEKLNMLVLKCPQVIERHQRREKVRVPVSWPVTITYGSETIATNLNDLSGGGLSAWVPADCAVESGQKLTAQFTLIVGKQSTPITSDGEVVNVHAADGPDDQSLISLKFISMDESLRQRIVDYVFDRQKLDIALRQFGNSFVF
jgi:c-di-GMP-binding flagellar brake protein YcgR